MKKIIFILLIISANAFANYDEGVEYIKMPQNIAVNAADKVEVVELFWYFCLHCYRLEPLIDNWLVENKEKVNFVRQPAIFSNRWALGAFFYYVLEELNLTKTLHKKLFNTIHKQKKQFKSIHDFINWIAANSSIKKDIVKKATESFAMRIKINKATVLTNKYRKNGINGVPTMIVAGKYFTSATLTGSHEKMLKVIDYLIAKENKQNK